MAEEHSDEKAENNHEMLADFIKNVHTSLRENVQKADGDYETVWEDHCNNKDLLQKYAGKMKELAVDHWGKNNLQRTEWCKQVCVEYFHEGRLKKLLGKDCRRVEMNLENHKTCQCLKQVEKYKKTIASTQNYDRLLLLDVGSCFNPFLAFPEVFTPLAIDLYPGDKTVYPCDFLKVELCCNDELKKRPNSVLESDETFPDYLQTCLNYDQVTKLPRSTFNVVVFSLLLSYLPAKQQRWLCCEKAHQLLQDGGLLVIITPDSSHQNKNMKMIKSWQTAIEALGFTKCKYDKHPHTHCIAFRKITLCQDLLEKQQKSRQEFIEMLYIHQDCKTTREKTEMVKKPACNQPSGTQETANSSCKP